MPTFLIRCLILLVSFGLLAGCGNPTADLFVSEQNRAAKANGAPFRWKAEKMAGGATSLRRVLPDWPRGDTKADSVLQKDILSQIRKVELSHQRGTPTIEEVRLLPDGREVWVLANNTTGIAYVVTLKRAPQGGTNFSILGPETFQKS